MTVEGTVIHTNPAARSYTLATGGGQASVIHAAELPAPTTKLRVPVRLLANGTYAEDGGRTASGHASAATISGYVTFVDPQAGVYTVSRRGVSALVHVAFAPAQTPDLPLLGANATVNVEIRKSEANAARRDRTNGLGWGLLSIIGAASAAAPVSPPTSTSTTAACAPDPTALPDPITPAAMLWQQKIRTSGDPASYSDFEGIAEAICPGSRRIAVSADDIREGSRDLVLSIPKEFSLKSIKPGRSIELTSLIGEDGSLSATGIARDDGLAGADDSSAAQGGLAG